APLPLQVGPGSHQPRALICQRRQFDLETSFMRTRPRAEDLQDETCAVDHLAFPCAFQISLLHGADRRIDHYNADLFRLDELAQRFDSTAADESRGAPAADAHEIGVHDIET